MDADDNVGDTLTCVRCGLAKPITDFDQRFVGKTRNLTCAACRGVGSESSKWQDSWARRRGIEAASQVDWQARVAEMAAKEAARQRTMERERVEQEREQRRATLLYDYLSGRGFSKDDVDLIIAIHQDIKAARQPWSEIKRRYAALMPPYTPHLPRSRPSQAIRIAVYAAQDGHCFYCQRVLLPLEWSKSRSHDGRAPMDAWDTEQPRFAGDMGIPELDHMIPVSRGGGHQRENLCYACLRCNQLKGIRTAEEFARYPSDSITQLLMYPGDIAAGLEIEARGYDRFDVGLPTIRELRRLINTR